MSTESDEMQCISCGGADPRCSAFHPEYGFTCIMPDPHSGPHYDTGGGHWTEQGQVWPDRAPVDPELNRALAELNDHDRQLIAQYARFLASQTARNA